MIGDIHLRQFIKKAHYLVPILDRSAGQFADYERVDQHLAVYQQLLQLRVAPTKVVYPNRSIDKYHADRLLGTLERLLSVPPKLAKRFALSLAIRACRPRRTKVVFSETPVSFLASRRRSGSIFSVVLICINMHFPGTCVKRPGER
jgi:hypothetical protein